MEGYNRKIVVMTETTIHLRLAELSDMELIFSWRNDPFILTRGSLQRAVLWDEHQTWFTSFLADPNCRMFIAEMDGKAAGQIRFHGVMGESAEVSLYLLKQFTGRGLGVMALRQACWKIFSITLIKQVIAFVRDDNNISRRAFTKAGFTFAVTESSAPEHHRTFSMPRPSVIPHNRLTFGQSEFIALSEVVQSGHWAGGPRLSRFETAIAARAEVRHAVAMASGLGALRLALLGLKIRPGDKVLVPAYSCVALANAVLACGAIPVPIDARKSDWNLDPNDALKVIRDENPSAIIVVNTFGAPAELDAFRGLDIPIIEDCAHAFGRRINGRALGGRSVAAILSFHATKLLGAGEGGMLLTNDTNLAEFARSWRDYSDCPMDGTRLNERMTDLEAALGLCQLERLTEMLEARKAVAQRYHAALDIAGLSGCLYQLPPNHEDRVWYRYAVELLDCPLSKILENFKKYGITAADPVSAWRPDSSRLCPVADLACKNVLSLPLYPTLTAVEQERVIHAFLSYWR